MAYQCIQERQRFNGRFNEKHEQMVHPVAPLTDASMVASELEVAVFIDTDFGTRLAVAVPPDITAGALKREVERVHFNSFPKIGEIKVDGFMVKQNSNFYHLPDTLLMKLTSRVEGVQFLHVKARPLNKFNEPCLLENADCFPNLNNSTYSLERQGCLRGTCESKIRVDGKKHRKKRFRTKNYLSRLVCRSILNTRRKRKRTSKNQLLEHVEKKSNMEDLVEDAEKGRRHTLRDGESEGEAALAPSIQDGLIDTTLYHCVQNDEVGATKQRYASSSLVETASELSSEVMSVSSIIKRYFSSHDEVSSVLNRSRCGVTQGQPEEYLKKKKMNMERGPSLLPLKLPYKAGSQKPERSKLGKRLVMASYNLGISPNRERPEISLCNSKGNKEIMSLPKSSCFEISDSEDWN